MFTKSFKKLTAFIISACMLLASASAVLADSLSDVTITGIIINEEGIVESAQVNINVGGDYIAYTAVYDQNGILSAVDVAEVTGDSADFTSGITYDPETQILKCFVWDDTMTPVSEVYTLISSYEPEETTTPETEATEESAAEETTAPVATINPEGDGVIHLMGDSINADGVENVTVDGSTVTIAAAGEYTIEGTLTDGQIIVNSADKKDEIVITLDGVNVTSSTGNAFDGQKGKITLVPTENASTFKTTSSSGDTTAIYSKHDLTIKGDGTLTAISEYGNGIRCKNDLEIGACDLVVEAGNNGIKGDESVKITKKNNSITINSVGDGIKSDNTPTSDETTGEYANDGGTVTINGGNITIITGADEDGSTGDGIQADTLLTIAGGVINIDASGEALKANASSIKHYEDSTEPEIPEEGNGCIVISGGEINVKADEDGIKATKDITINDGTITVDAGRDGIQGGDSLTAAELEGAAANADDETDLYWVDGTVTITGGSLDITAGGGYNSRLSHTQVKAVENSCKGIKAYTNLIISGGNINVNSLDDSIHSNYKVDISGGTLTLITNDDGVHGDSYLYISEDASINVENSYEGIEAAEIYVSGGETWVIATDDGANAAGDNPNLTTSSVSGDIETYAAPTSGRGGFGGGPGGFDDDTADYGYLEVSGGLLYIEAEGDGFDSNGDGLISGGMVLVNGPTSGGNGVFDVGDNGNTLKITGGTVIGAGTSDMAVTPASSSISQAYVVTTLSTQSAGRAFQLTDSSGNEILTYIPSKNYSWVFVSTDDITNGSSYSLKYGGGASGGDWIYSYNDAYGLKTGASYTGGQSGSLTAVTGGTSGNQSGPGGNQGGPGGRW